MKFVDDLLQEAARRGEFDNLPGAGRPLQLTDNPHAGDTQMAYKMVKDGGYTLGFVAERQKLLERVAILRGQLKRAAQRNDGTIGAQLGWQTSLASLQKQVEKLNRAIRDYNLKAPRVQFHLMLFDIEAEIQQVSH